MVEEIHSSGKQQRVKPGFPWDLAGHIQSIKAVFTGWEKIIQRVEEVEYREKEMIRLDMTEQPKTVPWGS